MAPGTRRPHGRTPTIAPDPTTPAEGDDEARRSESGSPAPVRRGPAVATGSGPTTGANPTSATAGSHEFALALCAQLHARGGNVVFSPFSVRTAARMALAGARTDTAAQMSAALHVAGRRRGAGGRDDGVAGSAAGPRRAVGTGTGQRAVDAGRTTTPRTVSGGGGARVPGSSPRGQLQGRRRARSPGHQRVGGEARRGTRVRDLVPSGGVNALTRLVLANAVWLLKDRWVSQFNPARTRQQPFYLHGRRSVRTQLMHERCDVLYARSRDFQVVDLGYFDTTLSMLVLLPGDRDGLDSLEARLSSHVLHECVARLQFQQVELFLPRFRMESGLLDLWVGCCPRSACRSRSAPRRPTSPALTASRRRTRRHCASPPSGTRHWSTWTKQAPRPRPQLLSTCAWRVWVLRRRLRPCRCSAPTTRSCSRFATG